jgi:hypothetical protein
MSPFIFAKIWIGENIILYNTPISHNMLELSKSNSMPLTPKVLEVFFIKTASK